MVDYNEWNEALGRWFFRDGAAGETITLTVDPEVLRESIHEYLGFDEYSSGECAENAFFRAVEDQLRRRSWSWRPIEHGDSSTFPDCIGLAAAQVLAVLKVGDCFSTLASGERAYWPRLAHLLRISCQSNSLPSGFRYDDHQALWRDALETWANHLNHEKYGRLVLPPEYERGHRHIRLPFSQALLRMADLNRLRAFSLDAGMRLRPRISEQELRTAIEYYRDDPRYFSHHARQVLSDKATRLDLAICQIARFLEKSGNETPLQHELRKSVKRDAELSLGIVTGDHLRLIFRIEEQEGQRTLELDEGTAERLLAYGRVNILSASGGRTQYRPRNRDFVLTVRDEALNKYISRARACPGDRVLLLHHSAGSARWLSQIDDVAVRGTFRRYVSVTASKSGEWQPLIGLPLNWQLLSFKIRTDLADVPQGWVRLIDRHTTRLRPAGGVRLGPREWLAGAGPHILVEGQSNISHIWIDNKIHIIRNSRVASPLLDRAGVHIVTTEREASEKEGQKLRIVIREPWVREGESWAVHPWTLKGAGWPERPPIHAGSDEDKSIPLVCGAIVCGDWPVQAGRESTPGPEVHAIMLLLCSSSGMAVCRPRSPLSKHPIVETLDRRRHHPKR